MEPQIKCEVISMAAVKDDETYFRVLRSFCNLARGMRCSKKLRQYVNVMVTKIDEESVLLSLLKYSHKPEQHHDFPLVGYRETWSRYSIKHWDSRCSYKGDAPELRRWLYSRLVQWNSSIPAKITKIMEP